MTSKEKIDQMLGIKSGESIDDFLDELSIDSDIGQLSCAFDSIDENVRQNVEMIDKNISKISKDGYDMLAMNDITSSLSQIEEMINMSKKIVKHCYNNIISTELVDSELIGSVSKLLESVHINISEFISLYRERQRYFDKIKLMMFQQQQKKELMELKHKHDLELIGARGKTSENVVDAENVQTVAYSQEAIVKMLSDNTL